MRGVRCRRSGERGAVAVEAALVTPIFLLLIVGIIEFGMVFKDSLAVSSSVRAGARIASAEPRVATFATDAVQQVAREGSAMDMSSVKKMWVYKAAADGTPVGGSGTFDSCSACVKFTWNGTQFVQQSATWSATQQNACQGDPARESVGIYLELDHAAITGLLFKHLTLAEHTVMNLEPIPTTTGCKP